MGDGGLTPGYFGFKFLESPTNSVNGKDDDDDGIVDESPFNDAGILHRRRRASRSPPASPTRQSTSRCTARPKPRWSGDEDGDWDPDKDDVGLDGIPGTGDFGEGNGKPDIGYDANNTLVSEPNFGIRDVNESDQIGLTSFWALRRQHAEFPQERCAVHAAALLRQHRHRPGALFRPPGDNVFLYGSGPFALSRARRSGSRSPCMMGENLHDLLLNSETAQRVLEANYLFAQPPPKPNVRAIPGDGRVTLYWDNIAESTTDPLTNTKDFEGYKIYRSEDYTFSRRLHDHRRQRVALPAEPVLVAKRDNGAVRPRQHLVRSPPGRVPRPRREVPARHQTPASCTSTSIPPSPTARRTTMPSRRTTTDSTVWAWRSRRPNRRSPSRRIRSPASCTFDQNTVSVIPGPLLPDGQTGHRGQQLPAAQRVTGNLHRLACA